MFRWFLREVRWISKKMHKENYWSYLFNFYRNANIVFWNGTYFEFETITTLFDEDNEEILTPNHLLYGLQLAHTNVANDNTIECDKKLTKRINHIKLMLEHFWSRWKKDYLLSLREHVTHNQGRCSQHPSTEAATGGVL